EPGLQPPKPKPISARLLKKLRWIEGSWRGTGDGEQPFFERYHFEGDSLLLVDSFKDASLRKVTDVTRFELRDGQLSNWGEGTRWVVTELNDELVRFDPVAKVRNSFVWQRVSKDKWKAILTWPANGDKPARERVFQMERWSPAK